MAEVLAVEVLVVEYTIEVSDTHGRAARGGGRGERGRGGHG